MKGREVALFYPFSFFFGSSMGLTALINEESSVDKFALTALLQFAFSPYMVS